MSSQKPKQFVNLLLKFAEKYKIDKSSCLEIGCGNGNVTYFLNNENINTIGIDVEFKDGPFLEKLLKEKKLKKIKTPDSNRDSVISDQNFYSWPCEDDSITFSFSSSVLEHVINIKQFASENYRILKKGCYSMHYLPSKYVILEPHVGIPFGGIFVNCSYFIFMCKLGLCFKKYRNEGKEAYIYMKKYTNYFSKKKLKKFFRESGFKYIGEFSKFIPFFLGPKYAKWISFSPFLIYLFSIFRSHIIIFKKY